MKWAKDIFYTNGKLSLSRIMAIAFFCSIIFGVIPVSYEAGVILLSLLGYLQMDKRLTSGSTEEIIE